MTILRRALTPMDGTTLEYNDEGKAAIKGSGTVRFKLLETLSPSGESSIMSSELDAHDLYLVEITNLVFSSSSGSLGCQLNEDTSNNYATRYNNGNSSSGDDRFIIVHTKTGDGNYTSCIMVGGKTKSVTGGSLFVQGPAGGPSQNMVVARWDGGNAQQVSKMNFLSSAGTMTGTIKLYGLTS